MKLILWFPHGKQPVTVPDELSRREVELVVAGHGAVAYEIAEQEVTR